MGTNALGFHHATIDNSHGNGGAGMKFIFKWLLRLFILAVVLVVIFFLSLDSILRVVAEHNIRAQTGMDAEIGRFHVGLFEPVVHIENLKLYNPKGFDGTPFIEIPEIHIEYDQSALRNGEIHITLARFNLGEVDIVKNEKGETNILALGVTLPSKENLQKNQGVAEFKKQTGLDFQGIDVLNVSVGTFKYIDLKDPRNNREQKIGIEDQVIKNIKQPADLAGLVVLVALRSGDFLEATLGPQGQGLGGLKMLGY
jgi:uncharacterized protein involved in outer membrane biogenesis